MTFKKEPLGNQRCRTDVNLLTISGLNGPAEWLFQLPNLLCKALFPGGLSSFPLGQVGFTNHSGLIKFVTALIRAGFLKLEAESGSLSRDKDEGEDLCEKKRPLQENQSAQTLF